MLPGSPLDPALPDGTFLARLARVDRSAYDVLTDTGHLRLPALPAPHDPLDAATVGDWLAVTGTEVHSVLPRRSLLVRGATAGTSTAQPLAANVDVVLICAGLNSAPPVRRIERLLTLSWESGATPVVVLTKVDLCADVDAAVRAVLPHAPGADVVAVSAATGDVDALRPYVVDGATVALLGSSGAGKSTLVNALAGAQVMATGDIRQVDGKGRHTTSHRELIVLPNRAVIVDTPGLRGVALHGAEDGLARAFAELEELASACRFADCGHDGEPGCAIAASIQAGDLPQARLDSWRKLQRELAHQARRTDHRLRAAERAKYKQRTKEYRSSLKSSGRST
ncbi:MAG: ribosome small subunit-dependent GTPase A [Actinobacteria bacterium]|nr:ribosome small subunit-dependent GTPase A [Actinomycetota bacterium]